MTGLQNFNPSLDTLRKKLGRTAADVYGRVWRYSQMESKVCFASQRRMASDLGLCRKTVNRQIQRLVKEGYLEVVESNSRTKALRPTGKAETENGCHTDEKMVPIHLTQSPRSGTNIPTKKGIKKPNIKNTIKSSFSTDYDPGGYTSGPFSEFIEH